MGEALEAEAGRIEKARNEARRLLDAAKTTDEPARRHKLLARALKLAVLAEEMERQGEPPFGR
jgi:hypothetical protein